MNKVIVGLILFVVGILFSLYTYPKLGVTKVGNSHVDFKTGEKVKLVGNVKETSFEKIPFINDLISLSNVRFLSLMQNNRVFVLTNNHRVRDREAVLVKGYVVRIPFTDIFLITGERVDNIAKMVFEKKKLRMKPAKVKKVPGVDFFLSVLFAFAGLVLAFYDFRQTKKQKSIQTPPPPGW